MEQDNEIDFLMLLEDITFPVKDDGGFSHYLFDVNNEMIADFPSGALSPIVRDMITKLNRAAVQHNKPIKGNVVVEGDMVYYKSYYGAFHVPVVRVRGWGRLQYKDKPVERQNNILKFLAYALDI